MSDRQTGYRLAKLGHELNAPKKKNAKNGAKIVFMLEFPHFNGDECLLLFTASGEFIVLHYLWIFFHEIY